MRNETANGKRDSRLDDKSTKATKCLCYRALQNVLCLQGMPRFESEKKRQFTYRHTLSPNPQGTHTTRNSRFKCELTTTSLCVTKWLLPTYCPQFSLIHVFWYLILPRSWEIVHCPIVNLWEQRTPTSVSAAYPQLVIFKYMTSAQWLVILLVVYAMAVVQCNDTKCRNHFYSGVLFWQQKARRLQGSLTQLS